MHVNLKVIAKMAGVSTATVSRVINDKAVGNMRRETCERIKRIIEATDYRPDALAAGLRKGSTMAIGAIRALTDNGYRVPQDISVLGYDNIFNDELMNPKITTVATPLDSLAEEAVRMIVEGEAKRGEKLLLEPKILVRKVPCAS